MDDAPLLFRSLDHVQLFFQYKNASMLISSVPAVLRKECKPSFLEVNTRRDIFDVCFAKVAQL